MSATLRFIRLECHETEDSSTDEIYITVNGNRVWGVQSVSRGEVVDLAALSMFDGTAEIQLWDEDSPDADDCLGTGHAHESMSGQGEQRIGFGEDGANYTLVFSVTAVAWSPPVPTVVEAPFLDFYAYLRLVTLECKKTEDSVTDELRLTVDNFLQANPVGVWEGAMVAGGKIDDFTGVKPLLFKDAAAVRLWEIDDPHWLFDPNDELLGLLYVGSSAVPGKNIPLHFTGYGTDYVLTVQVLPYAGSGAPSYSVVPYPAATAPPPAPSPPPPPPARVSKTREGPTGRNLEFRDNVTGRIMTVEEFMDAIRAGEYPEYEVQRTRRGVRYPRSKPDSRGDNNLDYRPP